MCILGDREPENHWYPFYLFFFLFNSFLLKPFANRCTHTLFRCAHNFFLSPSRNNEAMAFFNIFDKPNNFCTFFEYKKKRFQLRFVRRFFSRLMLLFCFLVTTASTSHHILRVHIIYKTIIKQIFMYRVQTHSHTEQRMRVHTENKIKEVKNKKRSCEIWSGRLCLCPVRSYSDNKNWALDFCVFL